MLARRHPTQSLPSPPPTQQHQLSLDQLSQQLAAQELLNQYLESQQQSFASPVVVDSALPPEFMTSAYDFANPTIRIQQSTPTPQLAAGFTQTPMLPASAATANDMNTWNGYQNMQSNTHSLQTPRTSRTHQRASSSSSIGSNGSQYQAVTSATGYPYVAHSENAPSSPAVKVDSSYGADEPSRPFSNHLPTPTHTPTHDSFMNNYNNNTNFIPHTSGMDSTMAAHFSMKQALMDQNVNDDDVPGFAHSARHSVSSYGPHSPATPHTSHGDDFNVDDKFKMPPSDLRQQHTVPKFERTYTDAALDNFYDPTTMMVQTQSIPQAKPTSNASLLSPYRTSNPNDIVQRTLQAAQNARSQSPSSSASRGVSPFRQNSPWRQPNIAYNSPNVRVGTASQAREQKLEADAAYAMKQNAASSEEAEPKTISPKEVSLDYREADEDSKVSLFPESGASEYEHQYNSGNQYRNATQSNFDTTSAQSYRRDSWATPQYPSNFATTSAGSSQPNSTFAFVPPSISGNLHGLPYTSTSQYRSNTSMPSVSDPTPDFPAHLHSMESSASEAEPQNSQTSADYVLQKPASSAADTGTYTCTYHGCTQRFETPQKLQKHKREGHRSANPSSVGSSMTSAALLERNSQAGPHKCERINPTTGKPCNTIFSRPYDLTRHEDTIHNARKQKVRCALCVEEKTFSRNDALTRHMRVVHPEIDFPGKHRRRGGNHD